MLTEEAILAKATQVCRPTCDWLGDHPAGGLNTQNWDQVDLWLESAGSETSPGKRHRHWRWENYPLRVKEVNTSSRNPLPSPHACWQTRGSLVICGPQGSPGSCHEWMSPLCLLHDSFWWLGMATQMQKMIRGCEWCIQHEGICVKAPMQPIIVTTPLELVHVDFTSIKTMMELDQPPNMVNLLVFCNHFTKHVMAYVTPIRQQKLLLSFCGKDTSQSSVHLPSSSEIEGPTLKATWSESFVSLLAYRRLGLQLTMPKPTDR